MWSKIIFLIIVLCNKNYAQIDSDDDYALLNKVIEFNFKPNDSIFLLENISYISIEELEKYYRHKFLKEKAIIQTIGYKYNKDGKKIPDYYTEKKQREFQEKWYSIYHGLDSVLEQEDYKRILNKKSSNSKWDQSKIPKGVRLVNQKKSIQSKTKTKIYPYSDRNSYYGNIISKPYYSLSGKYAIIQYKTPITPFVLIIFRKEKNKWVKIDLIKQHF